MSIISAIIQGILQGLTEFLPVSSSGHLSLYQYFTGINSESSVTFSVMLHLGTLLAVIIAFRGTVWQLLREFFLMFADLFRGRLFKEKATPTAECCICSFFPAYRFCWCCPCRRSSPQSVPITTFW